MQQNQQISPEVKEIQERANLVIKNLSNKLANTEVTNANLLAELEIANSYVEYLESQLQKFQAPVEPVDAEK